MVFAACMKEQEAPGTTFKKHFSIAEGLLSEDDFLLTEILLSPHSLKQVERISEQLDLIKGMIKARNTEELKAYFHCLRSNLGLETKP
jgi:prephenate dehydrogenase